MHESSPCHMRDCQTLLMAPELAAVMRNFGKGTLMCAKQSSCRTEVDCVPVVCLSHLYAARIRSSLFAGCIVCEGRLHAFHTF